MIVTNKNLLRKVNEEIQMLNAFVTLHEGLSVTAV